MSLPTITHLQFLVLSRLAQGEQAGRHLRKLLARHGAKRTSPAFYQMMARLEDATLVTGHYTQQVIDGQLIKERHYRVTAAGRRACERTRAFYAAQLAESRPGMADA